MKKRLISLLLAVLMVATLFSGMTVSASADATVTTVTLQSGDTVLGLCQKLGVDYYTYKNLIMALNGFTSESQFSKLPVGGKIVLPVSAAAAASLAGSGTISNAGTAGTTTTTGITTTTTTGTTNLPAGDYVSYYLVNYTIKAGETIAGIYSNWGLSYKTYSAQILKLNKISSFNSIPAGKTMLLPTTSPALAGSAYYTVMAHTLKAGESAYNIICTNYGLNFNQTQPMLQALNNRENLGNFYVGETLYIPVAGIVSTNTTVTPGTGSTGSTTTTGTVSTGINYNLVAQTPVNGSFIFEVDGASATTAAAGKTVKVVASPNTGYAVESVKVVKVGDTATSVSVNSDYSFTMPSYSVTVSVTFRQSSAYAISVDAASNGSVAALVNNIRVDKAYTGSKVTVKTIPATGFMVDTVRVTYNNYRDTVAVENGVFVMPAFPVTVSATFKEDPNYDPTLGHNIYTDVANGKIETFIGDSAVKTAKVGERVTIKVTPLTNYTLESLKVYYDNFSKTVDVEKDAFTMPNSPVTIVATIKATSDATFDLTKVSTTEGQFVLTVDGKEVTSAKVGQKVTITANSNKEYYNYQAVVSKTGDSSVTVPVDENGVFTMPDYPVTVRIKFYQYHNIILDASNGTKGYFNVTTAFNGMAVNKCGAGVELKVTVWGYDQYLYTPGNVIVTYADGSTFNVNGASFIMPDCDIKVRVSFNDVARVAAYGITDPTNAGNSYVINGNTIGDRSAASSDIIVGLNSRVWITPSCAIGYTVKEVNYKYIIADGTEVTGNAIYDSDSGRYYFDMPSSLKAGTKAELRVSFKEITNYDIILDYGTENANRKMGSFNAVTAMGGVSKAVEGAKVTIMFQPADGYEIDISQIRVIDVNGNEVSLNRNDYSFFMPASPVTIVARFKSLDHKVYVSEIPLMADGTRPEGILSVQLNGGEKYTDSQLTAERALPVTVRKGNLVTIINQSRNGYILRTENPIVVKRVNGGADPIVTMIDGDRFSFQMPDDDVVITAYYQHDMYNIIAEQATFGSFSVQKQAAWGMNGTEPVEVVKIKDILPDAGYEFDKAFIRYYDANGQLITRELSPSDPSFYMKSKPLSEVLVTVLFKAKTNSLDIEYYFTDTPNTSNRYKVNLYVANNIVNITRGSATTPPTSVNHDVNYDDKVNIADGGIPTGSTVFIARDETPGVFDQNFRISNIVVEHNSGNVPITVVNGQYSFTMPGVVPGDSLKIKVVFEKLSTDKFSLVAVNTGEGQAESVIFYSDASMTTAIDKADISIPKVYFKITPAKGSEVSTDAAGNYLEYTDADGKPQTGTPAVSIAADGTGSFSVPSVMPQTGLTLKYKVVSAKYKIDIDGTYNGAPVADSIYTNPADTQWGASHSVVLDKIPVNPGYVINKVTISYTDLLGNVVSDQPISKNANGFYEFTVTTPMDSSCTVKVLVYYGDEGHKISFINNDTGWGTATASVAGAPVYDGGTINQGSSFFVVPEAAAGYQWVSTVVKRADNSADIAANSDGSYTMPECDVIVVNTFAKASYELITLDYVDSINPGVSSVADKVRVKVNGAVSSTAGIGDNVSIEALPGYYVDRVRINYFNSSDVLIANREYSGGNFTVESEPGMMNKLNIEVLLRESNQIYVLTSAPQGNSTGVQSVLFESAVVGSSYNTLYPRFNKDVKVTITMVDSSFTIPSNLAYLNYTDYKGDVRNVEVILTTSGTALYTATLTKASFTVSGKYLPPAPDSTVSLTYTVAP